MTKRMISWVSSLFAVVVISACATDEPRALSETAELIGKCTFDGPGPSIEPGEIYLYAAFDPVDGTYTVVTGTAQHAESLYDRTASQEGGAVYPATVALNSLEFGEGWWIGTGNRTGELHVTGGETSGTQAVYPSCVFWPEE